MMIAPHSLPEQLVDILPEGISIHYLVVDKIYALSFGYEDSRISLSTSDLLGIETRCNERGIIAKRLGSLNYRQQLHVQINNETWCLVTQSSCGSLDSNSNIRMYGYIKKA